MSNHVPASTSIKRSRVGNIDTDRLARRRGYVIDVIADSRHIETRAEFVQRVAELAAIERELAARDELSHPYLLIQQ